MGMQTEEGFRIENSKIQKNKRIQNMVGNQREGREGGFRREYKKLERKKIGEGNPKRGKGRGGSYF